MWIDASLHSYYIPTSPWDILLREIPARKRRGVRKIVNWICEDLMIIEHVQKSREYIPYDSRYGINLKNVSELIVTFGKEHYLGYHSDIILCDVSENIRGYGPHKIKAQILQDLFQYQTIRFFFDEIRKELNKIHNREISLENRYQGTFTDWWLR